MFVCHPFAGDFSIILLFFFGKFVLLALFVRQFGVSMNILNPEVPRIGFRYGFFVNVRF